MEAFSASLALCAGNSLVTGEFPSKRPVTRSFNVFLICAWIDGWVNNREAGDVIRSRAHYDVNPWSFPWQAALPAWGFSADCLPGDYNIPRNSFNSLADLHEIWHTWHWWAEAIAHQFWVEYDNSEFSVPSMGMFNDLKLFMSNVSVGHLRCVYKSILHKVTAPY